MTADASVETRPINPLAALTLVIVFPGKTFRRLVARPHWILPLAFVAASVVVSSLLLLSAGRMDAALEQEAFRTGSDLAAVRAGAPGALIVSGVIGVVAATLLQTLFYTVIARLFGGRGAFRVAFSAVCHASVPMGLVTLFLAALIPFAGSAEPVANLSFLVSASSHPFLWGLASQMDVTVIWFFVLLAIAAEPVFGLSRTRARAATAVFAVVSILTLGWLAGRQEAGASDPYAAWSVREGETVVLHYPPSTPEDLIGSALSGLDKDMSRAEQLTGLALSPQGEAAAAERDSRIDCYLYPSLDEKQRATGNSLPAHRVEWAGALHLVWAEGSDVYVMRELVKLADARVHGKVYNPLVRDGLAVFAGGSWAGMTVREAGYDLLRRRALPRLDRLAEPAVFGSIDEKIAEPAAGSFMGFLIDRIGAERATEISANSGTSAQEIEAALASALSDSLSGIDTQWRSYLEALDNEPGDSEPGQR